MTGQPCFMLRKRLELILKRWSVGYVAQLFLKSSMLHVSRPANVLETSSNLPETCSQASFCRGFQTNVVWQVTRSERQENYKINPEDACFLGPNQSSESLFELLK